MLLLLGFASAVLGYFLSPQNNLQPVQWDELILWVTFSSASLFLSSFINGHNKRMFVRSKLDFTVNLLIVSILGTACAGFCVYLLKLNIVGRWVFFLTAANYTVLVLFYAFVFYNRNSRKVVIIGLKAFSFSQTVKELKIIEPDRWWVVVENKGDISSVLKSIKLFSKNNVFYVLLNRNVHLDFLKQAREIETKIFSYTRSLNSIIETELEIVNLDSVKGMLWWEIDSRHQEPEFSILKRFFDIIGVIILSIPAAVLVIISFALIKLEDSGPVLYFQLRLGQYSRPFKIVKLRTMSQGSESSGARWASVGDPRVTRIGKILRLTRLDELPQLWNILRGEMSFVGPRPERSEFYDLINRELPEFSLRLAVKPGLSGWAQVNYPYGGSVEDAKNKLRYDLYYIKNSSFLMEVKVITRTLFAMVKGAR